MRGHWHSLPYFFYQFSSNTKSILCAHSSQNQPFLLQRLDLQILHCQKHDESTTKQSVNWRRGQLSHLCTLQPPEALLSAGALWSSLTSCSVLPCAAGPILGGKPSLVTDLGTSSATYAQMGHTARDSSTASAAPEGLQQHKQSWVTGISFFCRASWDWGRHY